MGSSRGTKSALSAISSAPSAAWASFSFSSTIASMALALYLANLDLGVNTLEVCTRLSGFSLELKIVQMFQLGRQVERQLVCIPRQLLNLSSVVSNTSSSCQCLAKVSLNKRHGSVLIYARCALVILQP